MISVSCNFCSNDEEFIDDIIRECSKFSDDIHITYHDKFFNGEEENHELISQIVNRNNGKASFHMLPWRGDLLKQAGHPYYFYKFCHNSNRWNNIQFAKNDYMMFIDSDLIPEGDRVKQWLSLININDFNSYFFNIYSYLRSKKFQQKEWHEAVVVMARVKLLTANHVFSLDEIQALLVPPTARNVKGVDSKPMFHHYGWARGKDDKECKERLLKKVKSWGHSFDKDWNAFLEEEFSHAPDGKMHGIEYRKI